MSASPDRQALLNARAVYLQDPATGLPAPTGQAILYDGAGNLLTSRQDNADGNPATDRGMVTVANLHALNPAGTFDRLRLNSLDDLKVQQRELIPLTAVGAAAAAVTLSIPAGAAGIFNYLCYLQIIEYASVATVGAAAPVTVTTTGLANAPAFTFPTALPIGTQAEQKYEGVAPIKGSAAATAMTIVCPATTGIIWRVNVAYFQAA